MLLYLYSNYYSRFDCVIRSIYLPAAIILLSLSLLYFTVSVRYEYGYLVRASTSKSKIENAFVT